MMNEGPKSPYKALADPTRRQILRMLAKRDMNVNDIAAAFELTQPAISRHLAVLREAGMVAAVRSGRGIVYAPDTTVLESVVLGLRTLIDRKRKKP